MGNLQFSTKSHLKPEKLMSFIIDFEYYKNFFPGQLKEIKILDRQNNEITTEESVIFTSLLKSSFIQKSCHKLISDKELLTEIIEGPAKGLKHKCPAHVKKEEYGYGINLSHTLSENIVSIFNCLPIS